MEEEEIKPWKVLSRRYLSQKPWFTVREEHVQLPNGSEIPDYYVFEYPDWINVIAVTTDGRYVFERQYRHALGLVSYELCAGVCEPTDASPLEAARRELLEETGFGGGEWEELMILSPNPGTRPILPIVTWPAVWSGWHRHIKRRPKILPWSFCRSTRCGPCSIATGCCRRCMWRRCGSI